MRGQLLGIRCGYCGNPFGSIAKAFRSNNERQIGNGRWPGNLNRFGDYGKMSRVQDKKARGRTVDPNPCDSECPRDMHERDTYKLDKFVETNEPALIFFFFSKPVRTAVGIGFA